MNTGIRLTKIGVDEDMIVLRIDIRDEHASFSTHLYVGHQQLADTMAGLRNFAHNIYGGTFNLRFGEFGPAYASGALDVRLHFRKHAKLLVRVLAQSEYRRFEDQALAGEVTMHLVSEPALLDNFIVALRALSEGSGDQAELEAFSWN